MKKHTEARLEDAIIDERVMQGGYAFVDYNAGAAESAYDTARALDPDLVIDFIEKTQPKPWASLKAIHSESFGNILIESLSKELDTKGMLKTNNKDDFRYVFEKAFEGLVIDRMEGNDEISEKLLSDGDFRDLAIEHLLHKVYKELREEKSA